ncbi:MAG: hypothetical protein WAL71_12215 [Terriglobales bacterium]|jgi:hypothetical protein
MADEKHRVERFWAWFATHKLEFASLTLGKPFWDIALKEIKKVDEHLWFELSRDSHPVREFIVTAEGHVSSFPIAEELVRLAPNIEGWSFIALKPAQGFQFTTIYEGTRFDPRQIWFLPLESKSRPGDLGIQIAVPGLDAMDKTTAHSAVLVILDTGLGERSAALDLQHTELTEMPTDPASLGYIELPDLADYIVWRKKRIASPNSTVG